MSAKIIKMKNGKKNKKDVPPTQEKPVEIKPPRIELSLGTQQNLRAAQEQVNIATNSLEAAKKQMQLILATIIQCADVTDPKAQYGVAEDYTALILIPLKGANK